MKKSLKYTLLENNQMYHFSFTQKPLKKSLIEKQISILCNTKVNMHAWKHFRENIQSAFCSLLWFLISRSMLARLRGLATHNNFLPQKLMLCRQLLNSCVPYHLHGNGGRGGCALPHYYVAGELLNNNAIAPRRYCAPMPGLFQPKGKNFFLAGNWDQRGSAVHYRSYCN